MTAISARSARFTDELWERTTSLRAGIDDLEFLRRLGDGSLPLEVFRTYIEQDGLYLEGYSKALSLLAARSPDPVTAAFWATSAGTAVAVEKSLHATLLSSDVLLPADSVADHREGRRPVADHREGRRPVADHREGRRPVANHSQTCLGYVSYLIATAATESYGVGAAAALPCYWIYAEVGRGLASSARDVLAADPDHPYARWVTTYDGADFQKSAEQARELVDAAAESAGDAERSRMADAFEIAMRYELLFWDTALHPLPWPAS